ncbi:MAG: PAS domain-containing protein, partial [bacterium]
MNLYPYTHSSRLHPVPDKEVPALRKQKDESLKEELKLYKTIYDEVPCYITVQDRNLQILHANKKALKDFGNILGRYCYEIYNNSHKPCYFCFIEKGTYEQKSYTNEYVIMKNDENVCFNLKTIPVFDSHHRLTHIIEIADDITGDKKAQRLNIVSETISGIAHNIKNVVSLMNAGSYVVDAGLLHGEQEKIKNGWLMIQKNIKRLSDTVVSLINYTKDKPYTFQPVELNKLIEDVTGSVKNRVENENIKIKLSLDKEIHTINGDEDSLYHAILNLISNAVDACL